eukprot:CAMPEP_0198241754 /NCGR_PEP_ID=MMETSP1446-20131203/6479_1 /TAXON_ID=1461542 ORGANISM="Unidentified sp, Strain CCMP2111" /NCGR_SAMPLE_ID=MMETSP1446 /ASSEMBLY_ACC=CAM_ASM_001112 /LENGTH=444 /DNA_ID=CAMNT_0043924631 /DNA_START=234 /DNA_END=1568 /DNA_ORIENTATION=+
MSEKLKRRRESCNDCEATAKHSNKEEGAMRSRKKRGQYENAAEKTLKKEKRIAVALHKTKQSMLSSSRNESFTSSTHFDTAVSRGQQQSSGPHSSLLCSESPLLARSQRTVAGTRSSSLGTNTATAFKKGQSSAKNLDLECTTQRRRRVVAPLHKPRQRSLAQQMSSAGEVADLVHTFNVLREKDKSTLPDPNYLSRHDATTLPDDYVNEDMRTICCGWMVELALEFRFQDETLLLALRIFDRFLSLSKEPVSRKILQLTAITAMVLASKMEEVVHPSIVDFSRMSANTFTPDDVKRMEVIVLSSLSYRIYSPTPLNFVNIMREACPCSDGTYSLACYLSEVAILHYKFLKYSSSLLAAASLFLARALNQISPWTVELQFLTGYKASDLKACAQQIARCHEQVYGMNAESPFGPLKDKYRCAERKFVSKLKPLTAEDFRAKIQF